jgi:hypothetical protein
MLLAKGFIILLSAIALRSASSWHLNLPKPAAMGRLADLGKQTMVGILAAMMIAPISPSFAQDSSSVDVSAYFGIGCFWHVQHEFVEAERRELGRKDEELTAIVGYAGGNKKDAAGDDLVCYHNMQGIGDYGKKGYAEVVALTIPDAKFDRFAQEYFSLFGSDGERPDKVSL